MPGIDQYILRQSVGYGLPREWAPANVKENTTYPTMVAHRPSLVRRFSPSEPVSLQRTVHLKRSSQLVDYGSRYFSCCIFFLEPNGDGPFIIRLTWSATWDRIKHFLSAWNQHVSIWIQVLSSFFWKGAGFLFTSSRVLPLILQSKPSWENGKHCIV